MLESRSEVPRLSGSIFLVLVTPVYTLFTIQPGIELVPLDPTWPPSNNNISYFSPVPQQVHCGIQCLKILFSDVKHLPLFSIQASSWKRYQPVSARPSTGVAFTVVFYTGTVMEALPASECKAQYRGSIYHCFPYRHGHRSVTSQWAQGLVQV